MKLSNYFIGTLLVLLIGPVDLPTRPLEILQAGKMLPAAEVNFNDQSEGRFVTHQELVLWARNRNLLLVPDAPHRNMQDGLARVIPASGLYFELATPLTGRAYLYLDLVAYRPHGVYQLPKVHWLDVRANGRLLGRIYQGGGNFLQSPQILVVDREHAPDGVLRLELRPSPGDAFIAIWDAFVSKHAEMRPPQGAALLN